MLRVVRERLADEQICYGYSYLQDYYTQIDTFGVYKGRDSAFTYLWSPMLNEGQDALRDECMSGPQSILQQV
jgi:hypothetical protein